MGLAPIPVEVGTEGGEAARKHSETWQSGKAEYRVQPSGGDPCAGAERET